MNIEIVDRLNQIEIQEQVGASNNARKTNQSVRSRILIFDGLVVVLVRMHNAQQLHAMDNTHAQLCPTNLHNDKHNT